MRTQVGIVGGGPAGLLLSHLLHRSAVTLTALMARGHHEELATHLEGALRNGLTEDEIKEVLLHGAIYWGVPATNSAFAVARRVLESR